MMLTILLVAPAPWNWVGLGIAAFIVVVIAGLLRLLLRAILGPPHPAQLGGEDGADDEAPKLSSEQGGDTKALPE